MTASVSHFPFFIENTQELTVANVKGLMGEHLQDLKLFENETVIQDWINMQTQSDLDTLAIGLSTSKSDPTLAPVNSNSTDSNVTTTHKITYFLCLTSDKRVTLEQIIFWNSDNADK